ncbi:hypothetical protein HDU98_003226 [Podochytrium sp. JEL0797]|nr:hypothetical protein HDU98_003226 [Podochytrium sp. JEL0797]
MIPRATFLLALLSALVAATAFAKQKTLVLLDTHKNHLSTPPLVTTPNADSGLRLIARQTSSSLVDSQWLNLERVLGLVREESHFLDITDSDSVMQTAVLANEAPGNMSNTDWTLKSNLHQATLLESRLVSNSSIVFLARWLGAFTNLMQNRYEHSREGFRASKWVYDQCVLVAKVQRHETVVVTCAKFKHVGFEQFTVIARVERVGGLEGDGVVVLGANLDSFNLYNPMSGTSPGANENGSGCATIFEVFRALVTSGVTPSRSIEFHWYAASTSGRIGSQQVAAQYFRENVRVDAMVQVSRTGWDASTQARRENRVGVASDADRAVAGVLMGLVEEEEGLVGVERVCGFACSDHSSWKAMGFATGHLFEAEERLQGPYAHQVSDTVDSVSFVRMKRFVTVLIKLVVKCCV